MPRGHLIVMGSGETGPSMVPVHRRFLGADRPHSIVALDTPYGFQVNRDELTDKIIRFFETSTSHSPGVFSLTRENADDHATSAKLRVALQDATYVFAGPGSPSYAVEQWLRSNVAPLLREVIDRGGTVCCASAAAVTLGSRALPVYEIYKAGADPYWLDGLNLLAPWGWNVVFVPHYNNAEGGHYDTSRCYVGEMRLAELSRRLDHDALIIGIDEHTAAIFNFEAERIDVTGAGSVTFRRHDGEQVVSSGEFISFSDVIRTEQSHRISTPDVTELSEPDVEVDIFSLIASQGPRWEFALQELIDHAAATTRHQESLERLVASIEEFRSVARATGNYEVADQLRHLLAGIGATTGDKKIAG